MKTSELEAWVTSAVSEEEARNALVLSFSLKATYTTRKLVVIVSPTLPEALRDALRYVFDEFFILEEDRKPDCLNLGEFAKLSAIGVCHKFEKCIYLNPNSVATENADETFDDANMYNFGDKAYGLSNFRMKPSLKKYNSLLSQLRQGKIDQTTFVLDLWLQTRFPEIVSIPVFKMGSKNATTGQNYILERELLKLRIVNLPDDFDATWETESLGILEQEVANRWKKIFKIHIEHNIPRAPLPSFNWNISKQQVGNEPIAVVGMSCRFPKCENIHEFWKLLIAGEDGTSSPPSFRWKGSECSKPFPDGKINAGFLPIPVDEFDAKFFGISPKEAGFIDPQHRLLLEVAWEALEDAYINPMSLNGTDGSVFVGTWTEDYKHILQNSGNDEYIRLYLGNFIAAATARISNCLKLTGPTVATEGGCAASMVAVHLACNALRLGQTSIALAAGVNLLVNPFDNNWMPIVTSVDGHCKTFCEKANGYARAEGCGALVLKRLSDAVRDGDNIWAIIKGTGTSQEGTSSCWGTPTVRCESLAMTRALHDARLNPEDVSYIEAHGTGTPVGDPLEISAIAEAYHTKKRIEPLIIGSVKTNIGHTESCSGIAGIIKTILAMHHGVIPGQINFEKLNPAIDLDSIPAVLALRTVEWPFTNGIPRRAGVSSFGLCGIDAHVILEENPDLIGKSSKLTLTQFERSASILKVCAKSEKALDDLLARTEEKVRHDNDSTLQDICYSGNTGRADFNFRAVITARSKDELADKIQQKQFMKGEIQSNEGKMCFLFTGQGSQYPGMARQLYETSPTFRIHFDFCEEILRTSCNVDIRRVLWGQVPSEDLNRTLYSQTSIFVVEFALLKLLESWGVRPNYALGHSLGEFAAAVCAGILNVEDAIMLVTRRSILIDELPEGKMLVVKADQKIVDSLTEKYHQEAKISSRLEIAAVNSREQTVVAGDTAEVIGFAEFCRNNNIKCTYLGATHAFHSRHMDPMLNTYRYATTKIETSPQSASCEFISGMEGTRLDAAQVDAEYWIRHTRKPVSFLEASNEAIRLGCTIFVEVGPQPVLCSLITMNCDENIPLCLPLLKKTEEDWMCLLQSLGALYLQGIPIDWMSLDKFYSRKKVRSLPHYPFQRKKFWAEKLIDSQNSIHPLLGSPIKNASTMKLFQSRIVLASHEYLKDHVVGKHIIFPGCGYLEMCLKAGTVALSPSTDSVAKVFRPVKVENLIVRTPLHLTDFKQAQLQTVLDTSKHSFEQTSIFPVRIFERMHSESEESTWLLHAEATFSEATTSADKSISTDILDQVKNLQQLKSSYEVSEKFYEYMGSNGLSFGASFKSIQEVWVAPDGKSCLAKLKTPPQTKNQYILHPVALDGMVQVHFLLQFINNQKFKLMMSVKIGKFVLLKNEIDVEKLFVHTCTNETEDGEDLCTAFLLNEDGKPVAIMSGMEYAQTTVKRVEAMLEKQTKLTPDMWEEVWRPETGHMQHRIDTKSETFAYSTSFVQEMTKKYAYLDESAIETFGSLNKLAYYNILRALYECGLKLPEIGCNISRKSVMENLKVQPDFQGLINYYMEVLNEEGILKRESNDLDQYIVIGKAPSPEEILETLSSLEITLSLTTKFPSTLLLLELGESLVDILENGKSPLSILFPEGASRYLPITTFYQDFNTLFKLPSLISDVLLNLLEPFRKSKLKRFEDRVILRILEIGGGTGSFTNCCIGVLEKLGIEFEYTFTDISSAFFPAAQKRFEKWAKSMRFAKFNIEEDPLKQGLIPEYFDYICGENVVHATKNIRASLSNVALLLREGGRLDLVEMPESSRVGTYLFGVLDGYWRFEDTDLRQAHCTISIDKWKHVLEVEGLEMMAEFPCAKISNHSLICCRKITAPTLFQQPSKTVSTPLWILFHQQDSPFSNYLLENISAKARRHLKIVTPGENFNITGDYITVRVGVEADFSTLLRSIYESGDCLEGILYCWTLDKTASSQEHILQPYFYLAKTLSATEQEIGTRLISFFKGVAPMEGQSLKTIHQSTILGFTRSLSSERPGLNCRCIDIGRCDMDSNGMLQLFHEVWNWTGKEKFTHVAFSKDTRYVPKFQRHRSNLEKLQLPSTSDRFRLALPDTRSIEDLQLVPLEDSKIGENDIEIDVKAAALNFKDVLVVLQASDQFKDNGVGADIAGVVKHVGSKVSKWSVGDSVFTWNPSNARLHNYVTLHEDDVYAIDNKLSRCDAATLPGSFLTAYLGLVEIAKIENGDNVLVHTASGGVGLCALQLCKMVGANVICTVGSKRKKNFLRSLGIQHIFNSRSCNYGKHVLAATGGRGVDVVLNSLTSRGFKEETLTCCANGARFVEMSKLNVWTSEEVRDLRPDVKYNIIDVLKLESFQRQKIMNKLTELLKDGKISPLPYVPFDLANIKDALKYMQHAKHIGKVVCVMPERKEVNGENILDTQMFHGKGTYLITGGRVGGVGFAVCRWMVQKGARNILLVTQTIPTNKALKEISQLNSEYSAKVTPVQLDIGDYSQCQEVLENGIAEMGYPVLRGVMHCAGALNDGLVQNQEWESFSIPLRAKVEGTLNLHELTKDKNLEHFVIFSSVAGLFGFPGQANHCAANNFEDVFAHYRHSLGLPVTTISWGHWADVGVAAELEISGLQQFSEKQGIAGLEFAMKSHRTQIAICNFESFSVLARSIPHVNVYLDERIWKQKSDTESNTFVSAPTETDDFWREIDSAEGFTSKLEVVKTNITKILNNTLKLGKSDEIGDDQDFQDIGVDSLMYLEIGNAVKALLGRRAPVKASSFRDFYTISALSDAVYSAIGVTEAVANAKTNKN